MNRNGLNSPYEENWNLHSLCVVTCYIAEKQKKEKKKNPMNLEPETKRPRRANK